MDNFPKVSVLIPTYNYAHYLDEAIESVLNQIYTNFELIIVDDDSNDNTDEIIKKYLNDKRVHYYKNEKNIGLAQNFNKCLEYARGKYIKYLLADDKFHPSLLEKFVAIMEQYPNVSLVTSYNEMFGVKSKKRIQPFKYLQKGEKVIHESLKDGNGNWIGEPTVVMFRKKNLKIGNFNTEFTCFVDWDMWLRQLTIGDCYIIPETLSYFRTHPAQASKMVLKNYAFTFEDYHFYKILKTINGYKIDFSKLDIDSIIKKRATYCGNAMFELIPKLYKKVNRKVFVKAFKIAYAEKVIARSFVEVLNGIKRKI